MVMRGCKCAMAIEAAPKFLPNFSSAAVLCCAVRAGQLSTLKKITTIVIETMRATTMTAIGHEIRRGFAEFDIGYVTLSVERFVSGRNRARARWRACAKRNRPTLCPQKITAPHAR